MIKLSHLLCVLCCLLFAIGGAAAQETSGNLLEEFSVSADKLAAAIDADTLSDAELEEQRAVLETQRQSFVAIVQAATAAKDPLERQLEALGPAPEESVEAPEIANERARLANGIAEVDSRLRRAEQAGARAAALIEELNDLRRARFEAQLFTRGPSPLVPERAAFAWRSVERQFRAINLEIRRNITDSASMRSAIDRLALPVLLALIGLVLAVGTRRFLVRRLSNLLADDEAHSRRVMVATSVTLARLLLPSVAVGLVFLGILNSGLLGPTGLTYAWGFCFAALVVIGAFALGGAYFSPSYPKIRISTLDDADAWRAFRWLTIIAIVVGLDEALVVSGERAGLNVDALSILNAGLLVLGGMALWRYVAAAHVGDAAHSGENDDEPLDPDDVAAAGPQPVAVALRLIRFLTRAVALVAPLLALAGYFGASRFLFYPVVFSGALIAVCVLIHHAVREISLLGTPAKAGDAGGEAQLPVLPVLTGTLLALVSIPLLALIWGATFTDLEAIWARLVEGFEVGEVVISPVDFRHVHHRLRDRLCADQDVAGRAAPVRAAGVAHGCGR